MGKRVLGRTCETPGCSFPATRSGRCRSCAARKANRTRKLQAVQSKRDALDRAREALGRAEAAAKDAEGDRKRALAQFEYAAIELARALEAAI